MNNHNADRHKIRGRGLHVSTLSNKYDADTKDVTWVCVFCKLGPHKHELGDLFGPYIVSTDSEEHKLCQQDPDTDVFSNKIGNKNKLSKHKQIQLQLLNPQLTMEVHKDGLVGLFDSSSESSKHIISCFIFNFSKKRKEN